MTTWSLSFKPTFFNELLALPKSVQNKFHSTCRTLERDPISANGDAKKLKGYGDKVYRVRLGAYRLFYSIGDGWVKLLSIRKRDDRTYEIHVTDTQPPTVEPPPDSNPLLAPPPPTPAAARFATPTPTQTPPQNDAPVQQQTALPYDLSDDILQQWRVPRDYWQPLQAVANAEAILELDLPAEVMGRVLDNLYPRDLDEIAQQPEYVLPDLDRLDRLFRGDLTAFLLKLDPEQEKLCNFGQNAPVAVKGGAGTGKSTLALYRVRTLKDRGYQDSSQYSSHS